MKNLDTGVLFLNHLILKLQVKIQQQTPAWKNNTQVNKNTTTNTTRINVNKIHKQQKCNNNVYIYRDFEKVKPRTFAFKSIH